MRNERRIVALRWSVAPVDLQQTCNAPREDFVISAPVSAYGDVSLNFWPVLQFAVALGSQIQKYSFGRASLPSKQSEAVKKASILAPKFLITLWKVCLGNGRPCFGECCL